MNFHEHFCDFGILIKDHMCQLASTVVASVVDFSTTRLIDHFTVCCSLGRGVAILTSTTVMNEFQ